MSQNGPPPGSMPPGFSSPDMQSMMGDMTGNQKTGKSGQSGSSPIPFPGTQAGQQKSPRPIGTPLEEAKYMAEDVAQGLLSLLPDFMQSILHTKSTDTPEEAAKKRQMLQRYNQLNAEEQQYVQKQYQKKAEEQKKKEEEEVKKKQEEEQKAAENELPMPQGKQTGEGVPGASKKNNALTKMQNDRKKLSNAA
jgi:hypothetical protein